MKRMENESFEDYKKRRIKVQRQIKAKLQGKWFYKTENHTTRFGKAIPYVRPVK